MKAADVKIGGEYQARIGKETVQVRITAEKASGGWSAINIANGKKAFISMARLLTEIGGNTITSKDTPTTAEVAPTKVEASGAKEKPTKPAKKKTETKPAGKPLSQLEAAVKVLGESTEPLNTKQMVEAIATKNYWTSPGGKTPHATLYSAILRELQTKGDQARFLKTDRGHFQLRSA